MLELKNIFCGYNNVDVVKDISFDVKRGENICIVGPNGCGKSTLLKAISNLISYKGDIILDGKNIKDLKRRDLATKVARSLLFKSFIFFPSKI